MRSTKTFLAITSLCVLPVTAATIVVRPQLAAASDVRSNLVQEGIAAQLKLEPLRAIANAVGQQGRNAYSGSYSNLRIDGSSGRVIVYVTSLEAGRKLIQAAKRKHPGIDLTKISLASAKFTKKAVDRQIGAIMSSPKANSLNIVSAAAAPDGSGIQVTTSNSAASRRNRSWTASAALDLKGASGISVTVNYGSPIRTSTWRWNDNPPLIGGDVVLGPSRKSGYENQCTTGLAAEDNSGHDYLFTAAHCFEDQVYVYGEGDPVGTFGYNYGNYMGTVSSVNAYWDTEAISTGKSYGSGSNSDEADQPTNQNYAVNSDAYSYNGDSVCQDGARSYYTGHGVPCGIEVINQDVTYRLTWDDGSVHTVRGVEGYAWKSGWAVTQGDSGGLVFSVNGTTTRQARGSVSASSDGTVHIYWTEAPDILSGFGLHLNPYQ